MKFSLKKKTALLVTIIALTIAVVAAAVSYRLYAGTMDTRYKNSALDIARTAAALSDSDAVARYGRCRAGHLPPRPGPRVDGRRRTFGGHPDPGRYAAQHLPGVPQPPGI